jgi:hypothetical protein
MSSAIAPLSPSRSTGSIMTGMMCLLFFNKHLFSCEPPSTPPPPPPKTKPKPSTTTHYLSTTTHYRALPRITTHYHALPRTTTHFQKNKNSPIKN